MMTKREVVFPKKPTKPPSVMSTSVKGAVALILIHGPSRVMIDEYEAKPAKIAKDMYDQEPVVIFIRNDGWSLGASKKLVHAAERIWRDQWAAVLVRPNEEPIRYQEWCLGQEEFMEALS